MEDLEVFSAEDLEVLSVGDREAVLNERGSGVEEIDGSSKRGMFEFLACDDSPCG